MRKAVRSLATSAGLLLALPVFAFADGASLSAGIDHTLAIGGTGGKVYAWGDNTHGQLGLNNTLSKVSPTEVPGLTNIIAVSAGNHFSLALRGDGVVFAWGKNNTGQLGNTNLGTQSLIPVQIPNLTFVSAISAGDSHSLAVTQTGTVMGWGLNTNGQVGDSTLVNKTVPTPVSTATGLPPVRTVAAGGTHSLAITTAGAVWSWGLNSSGQLGDNTFTRRPSPVPVNGGLVASAIAAGASHSLALLPDGTVRAWGLNANGQVGDNTQTNRKVPVIISVAPAGQIVTDVSAGTAHSLALLSGGTARAWGLNTNGRLGDDTLAQRLAPVVVVNFVNGLAVSAGGNYSVGLATGGVIWAWGANGAGQLGDGTQTGRKAPVQISVSGFNWLTATPEFTPVPGTYSSSSVAVTVTCTTAGATIRYTTNGVDPTPSDPIVVSGQTVNVTQSLTLKARAWANQLSPSNVAVGVYTLAVAAPVFSPVSGTYGTAQSVTITTATSGASIRYTTDGSVPTGSSTLYSGAINVATTTTLTAKAFKPSWADSAAVAATYTMNFGTLATPTFAPVAGTYIDSQTVTISGPSGAAIRYTTDGSSPTPASSLYSAPLTFEVTTTLKAVAFKTDWSPSAVASGTYVIQVATPTFSPDAGSYSSAQLVTIACANPGAAITYTTNGVDPTPSDTTISSGTLLQISRSLTLKARAWKAGASPSAVKAAAYVLTPSAVTAGQNHSLGLTPAGTTWAWGDNSNGQLGDGTTNPSSSPLEVAGLSTLTAIASRGNHSVALKSNGTVWAWGANGSGQLGDGSQTERRTPVQVPGVTGVVAIAAGLSHTLALKSDGTILSWGDNVSGQLGDGTYSMRSSPVTVGTLDKVSAIAAGYGFSMALRSDGSVWAWGDNSSGQLGDGTNDPSNSPHQVLGFIGATSIAAGSAHGLALLTDRSVRAWGLNGDGQLGDGTNIPRSTPVPVSGLSDVVALGGGAWHSLAVTQSGTVWAWGRNGSYQIGDGTTALRTSPVQTATLSSIVAVAGGEVHSMALATDGTVWIWGSSPQGQLGDGTLNPHPTPFAVSGPGMVFKLPVPVLIPTNGTFMSAVSVMVTNTVPGVTLRYTINGSDPVVTDPGVASGASVLVSQSGTLRVKAFLTGRTPSDTAIGTYTLQAPSPTISPAAGTYVATVRVTLSATAGSEIRYTTNGSTPTPSSTLYSAPFNLAATATVKAVAFRAGWTASAVASSDFTIVPGPEFAPPPGTFSTPQTVTITANISGSVIRYTRDGTEPGLQSTLYSGPVSVGVTTVLRAKAFTASAAPSATASGTYVIDTGAVDTPRFSPGAGQYTTQRQVTVTTETPGAVIRYRTDGLDPDETDPVVASGGTVLVDRSLRLRARAFKATMTASPVSFAEYRITGAVALGANVTYALKSDGTVWSWGRNEFSALGDATVAAGNDRLTPGPAAGLTDVVAIAGGGYHGLAIKSDGTAWAWGRGSLGELGEGGSTYGSPFPDRATAVQVVNLTNVVSVAATQNGSAALKADGTVWAFGSINPNDYLGVPVQIGLTGVSVICGGEQFVLALKTDGLAVGSLWAWGENQQGQLGDGTNFTRATPVFVAADIVGCAAGRHHAYALKADGTVLAWGYNGRGQLGDDTIAARWTPGPVSNLQDVSALAAGELQGFALKTNGTSFAWGYNGYGQLGDGTWTGERHTPVQVLMTRSLSIVGPSIGYHTASVRDDGTLWMWGRNETGTLGDGTPVSTPTPQPVPNFRLVPSDLLSIDTDGDGLTNDEELALGTDGRSADTNGDGILDGAAIAAGLSATDTDMDDDGVTNALEASRGTDPFRTDTDGDGVNDGTDAFPLDPTRWQAPAPNPNDHTPPDIFLTEPTACLVPCQ